jgi:putative peptide zinc metalloprotease protein
MGDKREQQLDQEAATRPTTVLQRGGNATIPARASGVQLLGEMKGSGYRRPPALVRRADGQTLQLTPLLYFVLEAVDGECGFDEIAARASERYGKAISGGDARTLIEDKLRPLGVLRQADGSEPSVRKSNPLLALRFRVVVSDPAVTRRITAPFAWLLHPVFVVPVLAAFVLICKWVLFDRGLGFAAHQAFADPALLLAVFAITLLSAGFHEFGHAAAARYGGATPGAMGAGLYIVWPAFYTDVTDSYRLGRGGRVRTDLGGLYFNAVLSVVVFGAWWLTGWDALLLVIATQLIQMVRQLPPLIRFDGYHLLADITGVPDLFHRIKPTLLGLLPTHWGRPESKVLRPWAKALVTLWVLLVVPLMVLTVFVTVVSLPRILASSAVSVSEHSASMAAYFGQADVFAGLAQLLAVIAVGLPILGIAVMLGRAVTRLCRKVWRSTEGRPGRRGLAALTAAAVLAALTYAWWPHGNYRAIQPYERGTLTDALPAAFHSAGPSGLQEGREGTARTIWPANAGPLPTADKPALSLVLVPRTPAPNGRPAPTWVFPFNRPAAPGPGDNQTLAVNTKDGTTVYDVAFAMVWADGDAVLNKNEAYAFARCTDCTAVAVSFQVILIIGNANVVVPQNISAAVNYDCLRCVTAALAVQLVLTLPDAPTPAEARDLAALWEQIEAFGKTVVGLSFDEIHDRLVQFEQQIADIVKKYAPAGAPTPAPASSSAASAAAVEPATSDAVPGTAVPGAGVTGDPSAPDTASATTGPGSALPPASAPVSASASVAPSP